MNLLAFPGQGSQKIGMGKLFYENFSSAKSVFDEVDETLKFKLSKLIFDGDIKEIVSYEEYSTSINGSEHCNIKSFSRRK